MLIIDIANESQKVSNGAVLSPPPLSRQLFFRSVQPAGPGGGRLRTQQYKLLDRKFRLRTLRKNHNRQANVLA